MKQVIDATVKLLLFRAGPQDFPYSTELTRIVIAAALALAFLQGLLTLPVAAALVHAVLVLAVVAGFTWQLLAWRGLANRTQQTVNSLFATGTALTVLLLPMLTVIAPYLVRIAENPDGAQVEPVPALPMLGVFALSIWNLAVSANIYRHALNMHVLVGVAVSLLCALVSEAFAGSVSRLLVN